MILMITIIHWNHSVEVALDEDDHVLKNQATTRDGVEEDRADGPKAEAKTKFEMGTARGNHPLVAGMRVTFDVGPAPSSPFVDNHTLD
ncbi:unnamed protein product [Sphenostylis stenocarpa]|uniref:Uncharacterized protein n=1 Tax=Sphenostylis stenocarpa TaxID=92480 RepID=A0AA86RSG9_9FABA|nr:unnamed protein product [Sphenostylis stenocarpa]